MKKIGILFMALTFSILGCKQQPQVPTSQFNIAKDFAHFSSKMENNDTLTIRVTMAMCGWHESDLLEITKSNDTIFLQIKEKRVLKDPPMHFERVVYTLENDTLNLEKMLQDFDPNYQSETSTAFFTINPAKKENRVKLRTKGLGNTGFCIKQYHSIIAKLYPKEMEAYTKKYVPISQTEAE